MPFKSGDQKPPNSGRKEGVKNKFTSIKQSFLDAFKDERVGGTEGLILWILDNKRNRAMFYSWVTKMLPSSITGGDDEKGKPLPIRILLENADTNTRESKGN